MSNTSIAAIATMAIDIGKNSFHVIGLMRRLVTHLAVRGLSGPERLLGDLTQPDIVLDSA